MDDGQGRLRFLENLEKVEEAKLQYPNHGGVFSVGEVVELKGSRFRITRITPKKLFLRILPKN